LTANYLPQSTAFAASSGTTGHQVNPAATSLSFVTPPARARINTPTAYPMSLQVTAPGGGSPAGTITITGGNASCVITLPTANPSCNLMFDSLGARTLSASFAPSNAHYLASTSSTASTLVFALSDLAVSKSNGAVTYRAGDLMVYTISLRNLGPDIAANASWTCIGASGASCPQASGSGNINAAIPSLAVGAQLRYTLSATVVTPPPMQISNRAEVSLPADTTVEDPQLSNQAETDTDYFEFIFKDGFESAARTLTESTPISSERGQFTLLSAMMESLLSEVATAVCARCEQGRATAL
jgi:hypothetical protein